MRHLGTVPLKTDRLVLDRLTAAPRTEVKGPVWLRQAGGKTILYSMAILLVCWLPYFICLFPGASNTDTWWQLEQVTGGDRETRIFLRADKGVDYGDFMEIMNLLRGAGYLKIALGGLEVLAQPAADAEGTAAPAAENAE